MFFVRTAFFLTLTFASYLACAQGVKGRLTDSKNNPVPFAAVYDEISYAGTTSNADGYYELKLNPGKHVIIYKSLGYFVERRTVDVGSAIVTVNVQMSVQSYELKDVIVTPGKEDPAYAIMRKVIGLAPYHLHQVKEYSADVYLRGTINIIKMPKFISKRIEVDGKKGVIKTGDIYMEESLNQIDFTAPDKYVQKVKSFRTNFPGENTVSPMQIVRASFYQPKISDAISPLAPNAFSFYHYRYEGYSKEGEYTIFKIKVTPKRKSQQLLTGYIFVIDQLWCLHSVDVSQEMFFGKLDYKEIFSPVRNGAWLPISYIFYANAGLMGVKADYKYTSSVKYQKVVLNEKKVAKPANAPQKKDVAAPAKPSAKDPDPKKQKRQEDIEKLITKENLTNRDMVKLATLMEKESSKPDTATQKSLELKSWNNTRVTIEKDAMKKDTSYWNTVRPIPLTKVETGLSDSIKIPAGIPVKEKKDTVARTKSKTMNKVNKVLLGGLRFYIFDSTTRVTYNGLISTDDMGFNTVDGVVLGQSFEIRAKVDSSHNLVLKPGVSYGFSRKSFMWRLDANFDYAPLRGGVITLNYKKSSSDFNPASSYDNNLNALASLLLRRNYKKFYDDHRISISNKIDLANGLSFRTTLGYGQEKVLFNNSNYSFFYRESREYSPNIPDTDPLAIAQNQDNTEAFIRLGLDYTPEYYYRILGGRKYYSRSKYPTFFASYKKAIPGVFHSNADFEYIEYGARQSKSWGMMHSFNWNIKAGQFLSKKRMFLSDYRFFESQPLPVIFGSSNSTFFLPGLYQNATNKGFLEGHASFATPYLLVKYLPFLSNKIWLENLHLNYLYTPSVPHYWEAGYSISQIYAAGSIGVYAGFKGREFQNVSVRLGFNFD